MPLHHDIPGQTPRQNTNKIARTKEDFSLDSLLGNSRFFFLVLEGVVVAQKGREGCQNDRRNEKNNPPRDMSPNFFLFRRKSRFCAQSQLVLAQKSFPSVFFKLFKQKVGFLFFETSVSPMWMNRGMHILICIQFILKDSRLSITIRLHPSKNQYNSTSDACPGSWIRQRIQAC